MFPIGAPDVFMSAGMDEFSGNLLVCRSISEKGIRKIWMGLGEEFFLEDFTIKAIQD